MAGYTLNQEQQAAVLHKDGPLLVVAGAGTGKTSVIVSRILHLLSNGVDESSILAVTFTEKAAFEMLDRVTTELSNSYSHEMDIMTFNSFGSAILTKYGVEIGIGRSFRLVGEQGKLVLLRENFEELQLDYFAPISDPVGQLLPLAEYFSKLKQQLITPEKYIEYANKMPSDDEVSVLDRKRHLELANAYSAYVNICRRKNVIDYDDQIYLSVQLLEKRPNICENLRNQYQHILVDEFQDTNPMQSKLINLLYKQAPGRSMVVVGDDDQSIYGWRGATLNNILSFSEIYQNSSLITLLQNYRSSQPILDCAYKLIKNNNPERLEALQGINKRLISNSVETLNPYQKAFADFDAEIMWVYEDIVKKVKSGVNPGEIAVLARRGRGGVEKIHSLFTALGLDHHTIGINSSVYDEPIVQAIIQALRAVTEPNDNMAVYHTLSGPLFNVDSAVLGRLSATARRRHESLESIIEQESDVSLEESIRLLKTWQKMAGTISVGRLAYKIIEESGFKERLLKETESSEEAQHDAQSLFQWFKSLREFERNSEVSTAISYLQSLETLKADGELLSEDIEPFDKSKPVVMTVHKSKGLEWDCVYIVDCTEGSFPTMRRGSSLALPLDLSHDIAADDHYHEERRLMYVAMTRARKELCFTYSKTHNGVTSRKPSRFITEIFDEPLIEEKQSEIESSSLDYNNAQNIAPDKLPANLYNGKELILSATQISDYLRCPLDFYYRHVIGLPAQPSPHTAVGNIFHEYIHLINTAKIDSTPVPNKEDLIKQLKDSWPKEDYVSKQQRQRALALGLNAFEKLYDRLLTEPTPVSSESKFRVKIPDSNLILTGRIDAVYKNGKDIEIRDYKTSTIRDEAAAKQRTTASKQLELYALAYLLMNGEPPKTVCLDFVQSGIKGSVKKQLKTLEKLQIKLSQISESIIKGEYPAGYDHTYCRHPNHL